MTLGCTYYVVAKKIEMAQKRRAENRVGQSVVLASVEGLVSLVPTIRLFFLAIEDLFHSLFLPRKRGGGGPNNGEERGGGENAPLPPHHHH